MDSVPSAVPDADLQSVVRAVYRAVLGREPDQGGLDHHVARLRRRGGLDAFEHTLREFLLADEFIERARSLALDRAIAPEDSEIVNHVMSLGPHCFAASLLKRAQMKLFSGPFDWVFSSLPMVRHCLADGFATLLDPAQYRPIKDGAVTRCDHLQYRERFGLSVLFNHHNPATPEGHAYLRRCVERFRRALEVPRPEGRTLLLHTCKEDDRTRFEFRATAAAIDAASRYRAFIVAVAVSPLPQAGPWPMLEPIEMLAPGHRLWRLRPVSAWRDLQFEDVIDEYAILRMLRSYRLRLTVP